ncbi:uncharacterized protein [Nicotiana tomentosiformis]|uniref:uncharacterized protein n=1 Tax=Nicotiana tomentosiformis TaxID=4098 RepID=UPI00388CDCFA
MVDKGCDAYLAFVRDASADTTSVESLPVVRDFPDVFLANLPGMPPKRDIDFGIDLLPSTQSISIPPYHIEHVELKALKEQLQELLDKGFSHEEERWLHADKAKMIQDQLRTSQSRQKCYADRKADDVAYMAGERFLLRVSPMKGVMRFGKKGKLSTRYIVTFEILEIVSEVAYKLAFPPSLSVVHPVFYISMLQKYYVDTSHVLDFRSIQLDKDLTYNEEPMAILDRQVQKFRLKNIASMKVQWRGHPVKEATWETEHDIWSHYPHLLKGGEWVVSFVLERFWVDLDPLVLGLKA